MVHIAKRVNRTPCHTAGYIQKLYPGPDRRTRQSRRELVRATALSFIRFPRTSVYAAADWRCGGYDEIRSPATVLSMNFPGNFFRIGDIDTAELKELVQNLTEEQWQTFAVRQKRYEVHQHTQTIGLVYDPDFRHSHPTRLPTLEVFESALRPILWMTADHFEETQSAQQLIRENGSGYFIRASLVRLKAQCSIAEHMDMNFSLTHSHRVHLPIITNDQVLFTVGKETINMREGQLTEINNRRLHSVHNDGPNDRVHLVLDFVLPGERCCCGARLYPQTRCSPHACEDTVLGRVPCTCYPET